MNRKAAHMINIALKTIGLNYHLVHILKESGSQEQVDSIMRAIAQKVKNRRRELAKKYHPDVNNGGGEKMKQINQACDFLLKLKINWNPPRQQVFYFYSSGGNQSWDFGDAGTTTSY